MVNMCAPARAARNLSQPRVIGVPRGFGCLPDRMVLHAQSPPQLRWQAIGPIMCMRLMRPIAVRADGNT